MGIFQRAVYDICCDGCGGCFADSSGNTYPDIDCLTFVAEESGWKNIDGGWYCPDCCHLDEEKDEYVPNEEGGGI